MEIEAKFAVPDREMLERLLTSDPLCGYSLLPAETKEVHDTYLDTADRRLLIAGYACRWRKGAEGTLVTLKALTPPTEAIHRREEWQSSTPADSVLGQLPEGPLCEKIQQLTAEAPLSPWIELDQTRHIRAVKRDKRTVAELSLDEVHLATGEERQTCLELEIELLAEGTENDLTAIAHCLQTEWSLLPEPRSKFERALALLERPGTHRLLRLAERQLLLRIAERGGRYGRRARALLALDEGMTTREAGRWAPLSPRRVRHWLSLFRQKRLDTFPPHTRGAAALGGVAKPSPPNRHEATEVGPSAEAGPPQPTEPAIELPTSPGLEADDSMAEAARKTLYFHLQHMLHHEPGTRQGEDIEELHDMRVATRRMRAALRVFGGYLDLKEMASFVKGLRRTGRTLGVVRDLDVFREKVQTYLNTLPTERCCELDPLLTAWQAQRETARREMLAYLDSERYGRFKEGFGHFLQMPGAAALPAVTEQGEPIPHRLRHVVPLVIQQRLAAIRAYDEWISKPDAPLEQFHRLRIAGKELRYALEFFREVLGPETKTLINTMKALQDHLGNLQDAVVACNLLRDFLTWGTWGRPEGRDQAWPAAPVVAPGVATYLAARQTEIQELVSTFPEVWAQVQSGEFQQKIEAALRPLW